MNCYSLIVTFFGLLSQLVKRSIFALVRIIAHPVSHAHSISKIVLALSVHIFGRSLPELSRVERISPLQLPLPFPLTFAGAHPDPRHGITK